MFCKCGVEIPEKRLAFLLKYNKPKICISCASGTVERVECFQVVSGKTERSIQIVSSEKAKELNALSKRAGTGVSKGVKMDQSFKPNLFK
jgi:hypothetical protein